MIGVSYGAHSEIQYLEGIVPESEPLVWQTDMIREALNQKNKVSGLFVSVEK